MNFLRISIVQYLNTAPLVRGFTHGPLRGKYELSFTVPSECAEALRTGGADVAIIPAIEYQRIPDLLILPNLAIASKKSVRSLLLVSLVPIEKATRVALDRSSRSTQTLVRILCDMICETAPEFFEAAPDLKLMLGGADAALLIGDPALQLAVACGANAKRHENGATVVSAEVADLAERGTLYVYDIVELWRAKTNLPAVLAVWAGRKEAVTSELLKDFQDSLVYGLSQLDAIAGEASRELRLPASELRRYLSENIDYQLDQENLRGLLHYYSCAVKLGLIPQANALAFAAEPGGPAHYVDFSDARKQA